MSKLKKSKRRYSKKTRKKRKIEPQFTELENQKKGISFLIAETIEELNKKEPSALLSLKKRKVKLDQLENCLKNLIKFIYSQKEIEQVDKQRKESKSQIDINDRFKAYQEFTSNIFKHRELLDDSCKLILYFIETAEKLINERLNNSLREVLKKRIERLQKSDDYYVYKKTAKNKQNPFILKAGKLAKKHFGCSCPYFINSLFKTSLFIDLIGKSEHRISTTKSLFKRHKI